MPTSREWLVVDTVPKGFNYAYRRTASNNLTLTPGSSSVNLPSNNASHPPTKVSTPVPDRSTPPHLAKSNGRATSTAPQSTGKPGTRDSATTPEDKSQPVTLDRGEKEKERQKRERKKEKKERDRAEKDSVKDAAEGEQASISGKDTPISPVSDSAPKSTGGPAEDVPSPVESNGARTPTSRKPPRNPWTLFMRMQVGANEAEIREFFGEHGVGVGIAGVMSQLCTEAFTDNPSELPAEPCREGTKDCICRVRGRRGNESGAGRTRRGMWAPMIQRSKILIFPGDIAQYNT